MGRGLSLGGTLWGGEGGPGEEGVKREFAPGLCDEGRHEVAKAWSFQGGAEYQAGCSSLPFPP